MYINKQKKKIFTKILTGNFILAYLRFVNDDSYFVISQKDIVTFLKKKKKYNFKY